ncbi:MAG: hypothetical protein KTR31_08400 [Myxococcales bacterium]|nr:hypothetical protein [Myxococcales bacterium]
MKVVAHPLVVAVALGLLAPPALEEVASESPRPCVDCDDDGKTVSKWEPTAEPSAEEFHRVELAYEALTAPKLSV